MGLGAKQFPTYIRTLGQLGLLPLPFLMRPLRQDIPPPVRVADQRRWKGEGGDTLYKYERKDI